MERLSIDEVIGQLKYMYKTCMNEKCKHKGQCDLCCESKDMAVQALEEIQQCREYKEIFESHFSEEVLKLLSNKEEFGKWLERGRWIAKKCDEINRELEQYRAIGTVEELIKTQIREKVLNVELESYKEIGTIEEFKTLKEKSVAKKPIIKPWSDARCPSCGCSLSESLGDGYYRHFESMDRCYCGQKLDW